MNNSTIFLTIFTLFIGLMSILIMGIYDDFNVNNIEVGPFIESVTRVANDSSISDHKPNNDQNFSLNNENFELVLNRIKENYGEGSEINIIRMEENMKTYTKFIEKHDKRKKISPDSCLIRLNKLTSEVSLFRIDTYYGFRHLNHVKDRYCLDPSIYENEFRNTIIKIENEIIKIETYKKAQNKAMADYHSIKLLYFFYQRYLDCISKKDNYLIYIKKREAHSVKDICEIIFGYLKNKIAEVIDFRKKYLLRITTARVIDKSERNKKSEHVLERCDKYTHEYRKLSEEEQEDFDWD